MTSRMAPGQYIGKRVGKIAQVLHTFFETGSERQDRRAPSVFEERSREHE